MGRQVHHLRTGQGRDENFNVYAVNPPIRRQLARPYRPQERRCQRVRAIIQAVPKTDPDAIYVGINDRDKAWHDVYKVKISTGERTLVAENKDRYQALIFDNAGKPRMAVRSAQNGDTELLRMDEGGKATKIYSCGVFESCSRYGSQDNKLGYTQTNKGSLDLTELALLDPETGETKKVESDPLAKVDFGGANFSDVSNELILTAYEDDRERLYFKDKNYKKMYDDIKKRLGDREVSFNSSTADESKFIVATNSDVDPAPSGSRP